MALNLERQLLFYGAYHHDPVNVGIHIIFVPILLLTFFLLGTNFPVFPSPDWLSNVGLPLNFGTLCCFTWTSFFLILEPVAAAMYAPLLLGGTAFANHLTSEYGMKANYIAGGVHIVSWLVQFVGHGVYEGRAPALLDNLFQAVFLAPFFVWLEVLFSFGYRPELKARVDSGIEKEIAKFKAEKKGQQANGKVKANGATNGHAK